MNRYPKFKPRSLFVSGGVGLGIGVAAYFFWVALSSDSASGGIPQNTSPPAGTVAASEDQAARQIERGTLAETSATSEAEQAQIAESFREKLNVLERLRAKAAEQRKELASRVPNPFLVADYGRASLFIWR